MQLIAFPGPQRVMEQFHEKWSSRLNLRQDEQTGKIFTGNIWKQCNHIPYTHSWPGSSDVGAVPIYLARKYDSSHIIVYVFGITVLPRYDDTKTNSAHAHESSIMEQARAYPVLNGDMQTDY